MIFFSCATLFGPTMFLQSKLVTCDLYIFQDLAWSFVGSCSLPPRSLPLCHDVLQALLKQEG